MTCVSESKALPNRFSGCAKIHRRVLRKMGPRRRTRRCELFASRQKRLQPMEHLPPEYIVSSRKQSSHIPELHYCIGVGGDTLYDYAIKHSLIPLTIEFADDDARRFSGMLRAIRVLERLSGALLSLEEPRWKAGDPWLVARHSNHDWFYHMNVLNGPPDEEVFDVIRRELALTSTPKWYQVVA